MKIPPAGTDQLYPSKHDRAAPIIFTGFNEMIHHLGSMNIYLYSIQVCVHMYVFVAVTDGFET